MSSQFENPSNWRLRLPATVPFKYTSVAGTFEPEKANVSLTGLIPAASLVAFIQEAFPPPIQFGNLSVPQSIPLPGLPGLIANRVAFKSQDDGRPVDPFGFDPTAPNGTYHSVLEVQVEYAPRATQQPKASDPFTFLEITGNATGEFINSTAPGAKWLPKRNPNVPARTDPADIDIDLGAPSPCPAWDAADYGTYTPPTAEDPDTGEPDPCAEAPEVETPVVNRDPTVPILIIVPQTEWSVKWNQIPFAFFRDVLIHRIRACLGKVNSNRFPLLFGATRETLLFNGYTYTQQYTWRDGFVEAPPISLEMKFVEKRVLWGGVIRGHNDFWRPGVGWETLLIDGINKTYEGKDFNLIFKV